MRAVGVRRPPATASPPAPRADAVHDVRLLGTRERGQVDRADPRLVAGGLEADRDGEGAGPAGREQPPGPAVIARSAGDRGLERLGDRARDRHRLARTARPSPATRRRRAR